MKLLSFSSPFFCFAIVLLSLTIIFSFEDNFASAQLVTEKFVEPIDYEFGTLLIDVGEIDLNTGSYDVTFWLSIKTENGNFTEYMPQLDFVNGHIPDRSNLYISDTWYNEKIHGKFFSDMDFQTYPFTQIDLDILIEFSQTNDELATFQVDPVLSYAYEKHNIAGWSIIESNFSTTHQEYFELGSYPRYVASYTIETPFLSSFLVGILPILVIGALACVTLFYEPSKGFGQKGEVVATLIIAIIFYQVFGQLNQLPSLEYLTLQDKLIAVVYAILLYSIAGTFVQMKLGGEENKETSKKIRRKFLYSLPIVVIGTFLLLWIFG